jgi:hypothetical protein
MTRCGTSIAVPPTTCWAVDAYYILTLTTNIVSLGQLDEGGCDIHNTSSVLRIRDDKGRLVARVEH